MKTASRVRRCFSWGPAALIAALATAPVRADVSRDISTARPVGETGEWVMENAVQLEKDRHERTWTIETALSYAPTERLQFVLEPTFWERDNPDDGPAESGVGDTDFTIIYELSPSRGLWPAVNIAGKVKFPTADNREIGTGKADYSGSIIFGKELGDLDLGLELEYETYGEPAGEYLKDQLIYTLTADYGLTEKLSAYIEVFGNTAPSDEEGASDAVGVGLEYDVEITDYANPFVSLGVDTDDLITAKAGVEWTW